MPEAVVAAPSRTSHKRSIAFALCLATSVAFAAYLDLLGGGLIHKPLRFVAFVIAYSSLPTIVGLLVFRTPWTGRGLLVVTALVSAIVFLPWHPRKRFVDDLHSIRIGMTVEEVERVMGAYERRVDSTSPYTFPDRTYDGPADRQISFGSTVAAYDADIAEVTFLNGRVVYVEFQPD